MSTVTHKHLLWHVVYHYVLMVYLFRRPPEGHAVGSMWIFHDKLFCLPDTWSIVPTWPCPFALCEMVDRVLRKTCGRRLSRVPTRCPSTVLSDLSVKT